MHNDSIQIATAWARGKELKISTAHIYWELRIRPCIFTGQYFNTLLSFFFRNCFNLFIWLLQQNPSKKTFFYDTTLPSVQKWPRSGGYEMPIQYDGIVKEHFYTRKKLAFRYVPHGRIRIEGKNACADLDACSFMQGKYDKQGQCKYGLSQPAGWRHLWQLIIVFSDDTYFMVGLMPQHKHNEFNWIAFEHSTDTKLVNLSAKPLKLYIQPKECKNNPKAPWKTNRRTYLLQSFMNNCFIGQWNCS